MAEILSTAKFLTEIVLAPMFADRKFHFPPPAGTSTLPENFRVAVAQLRAALLPDEIPLAEIRNGAIRLSAGFLCERWCTTYRITKTLHHIEAATTEFDVPLPSPGIPFVWPSEIPAPNEKAKLIADVNKLFLPVIYATVLHEVGHAIHRNITEPPQEIEIRCDDFALEYLLGPESLSADEFVIVAAAIWLCCICAESLGSGLLLNRTHPNPVDRVRTFLGKYVHTTQVGESRTRVAIELFCVAHIWNLARLRRPEPFEYAMEDFSTNDTGSPTILLACLRDCWA